jgi:hypothetical protein
MAVTWKLGHPLPRDIGHLAEIATFERRLKNAQASTVLTRVSTADG